MNTIIESKCKIYDSECDRFLKMSYDQEYYDKHHKIENLRKWRELLAQLKGFHEDRRVI